MKTKEGIAIERTLVNLVRDAIYFARANDQHEGTKGNLFVTLEQLDELAQNACPADCGFQEPYGFVPEAGCPVHDYPSPTPQNLQESNLLKE